MKILVVDDHVLIRDALRSVLKEVKRDAAVLEASDCSQAMEQIAEHADIGLILLDLNLPDRDGFSVLAELRERYPGISVVVLSGHHPVAIGLGDSIDRRLCNRPRNIQRFSRLLRCTVGVAHG